MDILHRIRSRSNSIKSRHDKEEEDEYDIEHEQTEHETEDINTEREHTDVHEGHQETTVTEHLKNMNTQILELTDQLQKLRLTTDNKYKRVSILKAPDCLLYEPNKTTTVRRISELTRMFSTISTFDHTSKSTVNVQDFLTSLNEIIYGLQCQINHQEFRHVLLSKLHPRTRVLILNNQKSIDLDINEIYAYLLLIYDNDPSKQEALEQLSRGVRHYNSLPEFIEGVQYLLNLAQIPDDSKTSHFMDALRQNVDDNLYEKILDFVQEFEQHEDRSVPLHCLLDVLHRYKGPLNRAFAKKKTHIKVFKTVTETQKTGQEYNNYDNRCLNCKGRSHSTAQCIQCSHCLKFGHKVQECRSLLRKDTRPQNFDRSTRQYDNSQYQERKACALCGMTNHSAPSCRVYPNQVAVMGYCQHCWTDKGVKLYHAMNTCKLNSQRVKSVNMTRKQKND